VGRADGGRQLAGPPLQLLANADAKQLGTLLVLVGELSGVLRQREGSNGTSLSVLADNARNAASQSSSLLPKYRVKDGAVHPGAAGDPIDPPAIPASANWVTAASSIARLVCSAAVTVDWMGSGVPAPCPYGGHAGSIEGESRRLGGMPDLR
jgi:hypothetical protein